MPGLRPKVMEPKHNLEDRSSPYMHEKRNCYDKLQYEAGESGNDIAIEGVSKNSMEA